MARGSDAPVPIGQFSTPYKWTKNDPLWIPELSDEFTAKYEKLKKELDVEKHAHADGYENLPGADEAMLNETQLRIQRRIFEGISLLNEFLLEQLGKAYQAMMGEGLQLDRDAKEQEAEAEARNALAARNKLITAHESMLRSQRGISYFRARNRLKREAHYKESPYLFWSVLFGLLVVESFFNGLLLREISSQGLIGGISIALTISLANVVLGVVCGAVGWRLMGHRFNTPRALGIFVTVLLTSIALSWNIYIAHFREAAEALAAAGDTQDAISRSAAQGLEHLRASGPFEFASLSSWALLGLGIGVFFLVCREGWDDMADRYWDYKRVDQRNKIATAENDQSYDDFQREVIAKLDALLVRVRAEAVAASRNIWRADAVAELAEQRYKEVQDSEARWVQEGNNLLKFYRDENAKVRNVEAQVPDYWEVFPTPTEYREGRFGSGQVALSPEGKGYAVLEVPRRLQEIRARRADLKQIAADNAAVVQHVERVINTLKQRVPGDIETLRQIVQREAEDRVNRTTWDDGDEERAVEPSRR